MQPSDLPLVQNWLAQPHVAEWWGDPVEQFQLVRDDLANPAMEQFIVSTAGQPFGYVQSYDLHSWPDDAFRGFPGGTRAIDQFIGVPAMIERGHGSAFIRTLCDQLITSGAPCVITDPDPDNARAIRAYGKAGFAERGILTTADGPALLMVRNS